MCATLGSATTREATQMLTPNPPYHKSLGTGGVSPFSSAVSLFPVEFTFDTPRRHRPHLLNLNNINSRRMNTCRIRSGLLKINDFNPLRLNTYKICEHNPFRMHTCNKTGGRGVPAAPANTATDLICTAAFQAASGPL
jgi:hypothetical protein